MEEEPERSSTVARCFLSNFVPDFSADLSPSQCLDTATSTQDILATRRDIMIWCICVEHVHCCLVSSIFSLSSLSGQTVQTPSARCTSPSFKCASDRERVREADPGGVSVCALEGFKQGRTQADRLTQGGSVDTQKAVTEQVTTYCFGAGCGEDIT